MNNKYAETMNSKGAENVKVVVRCRPMDVKELQEGHRRYLYYHYYD